MLIGLTGRAGSGKSTVARMLVENHGFMELSLAQPMKDALLVLNPIVDVDTVCGDWSRLADLVDRYGWDVTKRDYPEVRRLLQRFGTECGRDLHGEDCWVRMLDGRVGEAYAVGANVVVSDVRFDNEARWVAGWCGYVVHIDRGVPDVATHASEAGVLDSLVDNWLVNDYGLDVLEDHVSGLVNYYKRDESP